MPALGKTGRMVGQRGQVFDRGGNVAHFQRIAAALEQQVNRGRAAFAPHRRQLAIQPLGLGIIGGGQGRQQFGFVLQIRALRGHG